MTLLQTVRQTVRRFGMLSNGDSVLVAVSGGPDSTAMLRVLYELREEFGLRLEVAHLQHGIRGAESRADAEFVADLATRLGLRCHLQHIDLLKLKAERRRGNLEALGREYRYRFFAALARRRGISKIATGHTQDDQAETVLMWLLRGCGSRGLGGMSPISPLELDADTGSDRLTLIRPLLETCRTDVLRFLEVQNLPYREDRSNHDPKLLRNWIRLRLIPEIRDRMDPHLPARLARQAEVVREEQMLLNRLALEELDKIAQRGALDRELLLKRDTALQRLILRRWLENLRGHLRGIDFDHIEDLLRLIKRDEPHSRFSIPGRWEFVREYNRLKLQRPPPGAEPYYSYQIELGAELEVPEAGMVIRSRRVRCSSSARSSYLPATLMEAVFDLACVPEKLTVRNFHRGDRLQPLGMTGRKKMKEVFRENKVPRSLRPTLPLVTLGAEVLWIPGYARSDTGKITPKTNQILHLAATVVSDR